MCCSCVFDLLSNQKWFLAAGLDEAEGLQEGEDRQG